MAAAPEFNKVAWLERKVVSTSLKMKEQARMRREAEIQVDELNEELERLTEELESVTKLKSAEKKAADKKIKEQQREINRLENQLRQKVEEGVKMKMRIAMDKQKGKIEAEEMKKLQEQNEQLMKEKEELLEEKISHWLDDCILEDELDIADFAIFAQQVAQSNDE